MAKNKLGLIGCGTIGFGLLQKVQEELKDQIHVAYLSDLHIEKVNKVKKDLSLRATSVSIDQMIEKSDIIVEAASAQVAAKTAIKALRANKIVLLMSIGGIVDCFEEVQRVAQKSKGKLLLPSGAIAGLDAIAAVRGAKIHSVSLKTTKPIEGLMGAPYLEKNKINLSDIKSEKTIFKGNALAAAKAFPKNINVGALLSLATLGPKKIQIEIVASKKVKRNIHQISLEGDFGKIETRTENVPSPTNPKTSYLAVLSAFATLKRFLDVIQLGN